MFAVGPGPGPHNVGVDLGWKKTVVTWRTWKMWADGYQWWWLSDPSMTVCVELRKGIIATTPPILRRFIGQPFGNLLAWKHWEVHPLV